MSAAWAVLVACWLATIAFACLVLEAHVRTRSHGYEVHVAQALAVVEPVDPAELRRHLDNLAANAHELAVIAQYEEDFQ